MTQRQHKTRPLLSRDKRKRRSRSRLSSPFIATFVVLALLIANIFAIQVLDVRHLKSEATSQAERTQTLYGKRGLIVDRKGNVLAESVSVSHLTFQPQQVKKILRDIKNAPQHPYYRCGDKSSPVPYEQYVSRMIDYIRQKNVVVEHNIEEKLMSGSFHYVAKNVPPDIARTIHHHCPLVGVEEGAQRHYPGKTIAMNIIGLSNAEHGGISGLEQFYDRLLSSRNGSLSYRVTADGTLIPASVHRVDPQQGRALALTLDSALQTVAQSELEKTVYSSHARSGHMVIMDGWSGDILAIADSGSLTTDLPLEDQPAKAFGTPSLIAPFEPGSVAKILTISAALEKKIVMPSTLLTVTDTIHIDGLDVSDAWVHGTIPMTVEDIFAQSSNVGTLMIANKLGKARFWDMLSRYPLGVPTGIQFPGEASGVVTPITKWQPGAFGNYPIGQGFSLSLLQMALLYQPYANQGILVRPSLIIGEENKVSHVWSPPTVQSSVVTHYGDRIIPQHVVSTMVAIMTKTFTNPQGTGHSVNIDGFPLMGKTGTAQQVDPRTGAYSPSLQWSTFAGLAPDRHTGKPRYVLAIMLDNPTSGTAVQLYARMAPFLTLSPVSESTIKEGKACPQ